MQEPLRIAFVPGVTPDKWSRTWRDREPGIPLELTLVERADQESVLRDGRVDMCFVRLPVDRDGLHLIPLYEELAVVVVPLEHPVAAYDEVPLADLADEQLVVGEVDGWAEVATATPLEFPEMTVKEAFEVVASGTGMAIVPMSVARLHHRKDLTHRPVTDAAPTQIGLAWLVDNEDVRLDRFIGVVRGRRATSSRGEQPADQPPKKAKKPPAKKAAPRRSTQQKQRPAARRSRRR
ncbi:MAG: LysR family substrate-binding domain-containing protein [Nocardioides sp.]